MHWVNFVFELITGLLALVVLAVSSGIFTKTPRRDTYVYYTNLSNLIVGLFYILRCAVNFFSPRAPWLDRLLFSDFSQYAVSVMILVTFLVYHFVLMPSERKKQRESGDAKSIFTLSNVVKHYVVPLAAVVDWVFFAGKSGLRWYHPLLFALIPLLYAAFAFVRASNGRNIENTDSPYPYFFMDPKKLGAKKTATNVLLLFVAFIALGFAVFGISKLF